MATKTDIYVDTSALISFLDKSDSYHPLFRRLFCNPSRLITTSLVIAEGHGWFLRRYDILRGLAFLSFVEELAQAGVLKIVPFELLAGYKILRKFSDQTMTLTDAVGLALMKQNKIRECWSTDRHLGLMGVELVINCND